MTDAEPNDATCDDDERGEMREARDRLYEAVREEASRASVRARALIGCAQPCALARIASALERIADCLSGEERSRS